MLRVFIIILIQVKVGAKSYSKLSKKEKKYRAITGNQWGQQ